MDDSRERIPKMKKTSISLPSDLFAAAERQSSQIPTPKLGASLTTKLFVPKPRRPRSFAVCLVSALASYCVSLNIVLAHEPLTEEQIASMKREGSFEERMQRVRWLEKYRMSIGVAENAVYKIQRDSLRANGMSPRDIGHYLFGDRVMAFPYAATPELKSIGTVKTLTILVDFKDHRAATELPGMTPNIFQQNIYGSGTAAAQRFTPHESVSAYYRRASQGKVDIQGNVLGWYHFPNDRRQYQPTGVGTPEQKRAANNAAIFKMVSEALNSLGAGHNFAQYDNDNDGDIDLVTILYAGPDSGWMSFWWAYQWRFFVPEANRTTFGSKKLKQFVFQFVDKRDQTDFDPSTLLHEMGHAFGLADYYDYDKNVGPTGGVGGLDMMDANKGNQNAFSRWLLDWIQPDIVGSGSPATHQLVASGSPNNTHKAVAIFPQLRNTNAPGQELFIVENRFRTGNDSGVPKLPNDGLLVWHVAADPNTENDDFLYDNSYTDRKLIRLVRADSAVDFPAGVTAGAGTYFCPPREFTPNSTPNTNSYSGDRTNIVLSNISAPGETMTVNIGFAPPSSPPAAPGRAPATDGSASPGERIEIQSDSDAEKEVVDVPALEALLQKFRSSSPETLSAAWKEALTESSQQRATRQSEVARQIILTQWAARDGKAAVGALLELPTNEFTKEAFSRVMETWANHDPSGAAQWYFAEKNRKETQARGLVAGQMFAEPVFKWYAQNDYKKTVSLLDQVQVSEIEGALTSLKEVGEMDGDRPSVLKDEIAKLKQNRNVIEAIYRLQEAKEQFEKHETNPRTRQEFRSLLHRPSSRSPDD
jgi:M6 family metalloprotease-like protein